MAQQTGTGVRGGITVSQKKHSTPEEQRANELQQAVARFEEAVQELARGAANDLADRATGLIDETTSRIRNVAQGAAAPHQGDRAGYADDDRSGDTSDSGDSRDRYANDTYSWRYGADSNRLGDDDVPSEKLYRDRANGRIAGVCAGFARYFGVDTWVARLGAITGLLFLPAIVFPSYWIAYLLMDDDPKASPRRRRGRRSRRRERREQTPAQTRAPAQGQRSQTAITPRRLLRHVTADLNAAELRLRRMEGHVTSSEYELRRQLKAIDA